MTRGIHILIVESNEVHADQIRRVFKAKGSEFSLTVASCLSESKAYIDNFPPDLIIANMDLPDGKGNELIPNPNHQTQYPVIIMIHLSKTGIADELIQKGAMDCVVISENSFEHFPRIASRVLSHWDTAHQLKKAKKRIVESERRFSSLVNNIPGAVYRCKNDADWTVMLFSHPIENISGYPPEDFIENKVRSYASIIHEADREKVAEKVSLALKKCVPFSLEYRVLHKDGSTKWVMEQGQGVFGENGECLYLDGTIFDITNWKAADIKIKASEERLRNIANYANSSIYIKDMDGKYTFINRQFENIWGMTEEQVLGKTDHELLPKKIAQTFARHEKVVLSSGKPKAFEEQFELADGNHYYLATKFPFIKSSGEPYAIGSISTNITERKWAEEEIRLSEGRFRAIFDEAPLGIAVINSITGNIYEVNPRFASITGRTRDELVAIDWMSITHPDDIQEDLDNMKLLIAGKILSFSMHKRYLRSDNSYVWVNFSVAPITTTDKNTPHHLCMIEDITEQKLAEESIRKLSRAVDQSPTSIIITDKSGIIEYVNPSFTQSTGYTDKEVVGKNPHILKSGETPQEEYEQLWDTITSGKSWYGTFHNKKKDGTLFWESAVVSPIKDASGHTTHFISIKENITQERLIEEKLLESEKRFRTFVNQAADAIFVHDIEGRLVHVNQRACESLGYTNDELMRLSVFDFEIGENGRVIMYQ
jgi:PAS domain S-box-containing protein